MAITGGRILVYGATGYTGRLIAEEAARQKLPVVLAGRHRERLSAVAEPLGLPARVASLGDGDALRRLLDGIDAVLHVAGPFSATAAPMLEACLQTGTHYLDVTGEIGVFETVAHHDAQARDRSIAMLPGVGFDVIPTDCVAARAAAAIESPRRLRIAIAGAGNGTTIPQ